ncbi:xanthine dehydrogenase/oxidase-like [Trichoplusia ni]|uniref:Xanthine dehydrogenase/oxidase-like n=1 Tax=Trichoplusia ni TaxID=7111 RepID=A0A7E5WN25_TRINI|nr:xanthine dehydrogenase/oxidase-like [Trichoplusia ni]
MEPQDTVMDRIKFKVNGIQYSVGSEISSDEMLLDYLRSYLQLRGTKYMCREGGCGACIVTASKCPGGPQVSINSCMVSIGSCEGWDIRTIEALGNKKAGYHPLQKTLADHHGTQCGYCTCGWIMAMHGLLESKKRVTMLEIEQAFGSNVCRCTGYRPILDAFKKFAVDAPKDRIMDIEDLSICKKSGKPCNQTCEDDEWCLVDEEDVQDRLKRIVLRDGKIWYKPRVLLEVFSILLTEGPHSYMLVNGNTAKGAYPIDQYPRLLIDISNLKELKSISYDQNLVVGAGLTLSEFLEVLDAGSKQQYFGYLRKLYDHVSLVAHIPVRNVGTIAGNLMIKHTHNEFPSDIYLLLNTVGAQLSLVDFHGARLTVTMEHFLRVDMTGKVIINVLLPPMSDSHKLYTYKLMPRAQSAHAIVNAGFLYKLHPNTSVVESSRIIYGGLSTKFPRAVATEQYLVGKNLFSNDTLQGALRVLDGEMIVEANPPEQSVEYRRFIAKALFYKGLLTLCPPKVVAKRYQSGTDKIHDSRPVSDGKQTFTTDPTMWPLNQPIVKVEAAIQCSGEAQYTDDIPSIHNEVFGAFVLSTVAKGTIAKIDPSAALNLPGVLAFYTAKDIPGLNSFTPADSLLYTSNEEVLCDGNVKYYHQPIGIVVAETQLVADRAARYVRVQYSNITKPVTDVKEAKKDAKRNTMFVSMDATNPGTDVFKTIKGSNTFYGQYHFTMETLACVAKPTEEGIEVHSTTQWLDGVHVMISRALNIPENKIDVHVRRLGGAYGIKISRNIQCAVACSLVVHKMNRPCRFIQPLTTNMRAVGKRLPCSSDFEVAVNHSGQIQKIDLSIYEDNGYKINETLSALGVDVFNNCYDATRFNYKLFDTITDTAKNSWCRSPGTLEAIASIEYVMEQISYELSLDPVAVRLANLDRTKYSDMVEMVELMKTNSEFTKRRSAVDSFNTQNRWKKRGLRWAFSRWSPAGAQRFDVNLSVFHADGSVVITHAGVEMGQGINTKAVQLAAYLLKIPIEKIQIKGNNTIIAPNSFISGGSLTTQSIIIALRRCCDELNARLEPIRTTLTNPTWEALITAAYNANVDLQAHGFVHVGDAQMYNVYGMALCEVEVDILTGEFEVIRVDILQDVGFSVSPEIDVGQVEGAFIMGLGYWTCERLVYSEDGAMVTDRTWDYHVPQARDIPQDFRVYFKKNSYSNEVILGSKGTGEPATCASVVVAFALREAIVQARQDSGIPTTQWFSIDGPYTTEKVCMSAQTNTKDFRFY